MNYKFIIFLFLISFSTIAQQRTNTQGKETSLRKVLSELEESYGVKFSYNADIVSKERVILDSKKSLPEAILAIQSQTSLIFERLDERYFAVRSKYTEGNIKVCGYVIDLDSKKGLPDCLVTANAGRVMTKSDEDGFFELYLSNKNTVILFLREEYLTKRVSALMFDKSSCPKIELTADGYMLEEVLITDYLKDNYFSKNNGEAYSFNPNEMGVLPGNAEPDILETLQVLPGVQGPTENATQLFIRGGNPSENLVLWDGIKIYNSGHLFGSISSFNPHITENVNLYRSGFNPRYGGAISGIVDIQSEDNVPEQLSGGLGITTTHADAFLKIPLGKKIGIIVSGRTSINSLIETGTFKNYLNRSLQNAELIQDQPRYIKESIEVESIPEFSDFTSKVIIDLNKNLQIGASGIYSKNQLQYNFRALQDSIYFPEEANIQQDQYLEENKGASVFLDYQITDKLAVKLSGYYSDFNRKYVNYERRFNEIEDIDTNKFFADSIDIRNKLIDRGIIATSKWNLVKEVSLETGIEVSETKVLLKHKYFFFSNELRLIESRIDSIEDVNFSRAIFSNLKITPNHILSVNLGARVNDFSYLDYLASSTVKEVLVDTDRLYVDPRCSVRVQLFPKFRTRFIYERNHQLLTQLDAIVGFNFQLNQNFWRFPEKNEETQFLNRSVSVADQYIAGGMYKGRTFSLDFDFYYKEVNNNELLDLVGSSNFTLKSLGTRVARGIDILAKKQFSTNFSTLIGYSLSKQEYKFADINDDRPFPGNYDSTHNVSIIQSAEFDNFEFSLGWKYRTGIPYHTDVSLNSNNSAAITINSVNDGRLPDYHRLDFTASYSSNFKKKSKLGYKIAISLLNLYDRRNTLQRLYLSKNNRVDAQNDFFLDVRDTRSLGFTPNVSLRFRF